MKKKLLLSGLIALCLIAGTGVATFAERGYISVSQSKTMEISPNIAEITIKIETADKDMKTAVNKNKEIAKNVYSAIKSLVNCDNGDYIKTGEFTATPNYNYKDGKRIFDKFSVVNSVNLKTKNIENISKIIDTAVKNGATTVSDVQFKSADYTKDCNKMYLELTRKAYIQATVVALASGEKIKGIKTVSTSCSPENNERPYYRMMATAMSKNDASSSTPIESGKLKLYANIDASFYVK